MVLVLVFVGSLAEDPPVDSNQRFFGGIFNDFFGNHNQCNNCRYNYYQAEQCCQNGLDYNCCQYVNGNNGNYYPGNNGNYYPGSTNGNYNKPGVCPSSNYYGRKRRSPETAQEAARYWPGNSGSPYVPRPDYGNNGLHWNNQNNNQNYGSCYSDRDCPGSQKCCSNSYGSTICKYPNNYGRR